MERTLKQAIAEGAGVAIGLIDIDNFAAINIEFGHDVGDTVLKQVAQHIRENDCDGYRLSGDEFAVIMEGVSLEQGFLRMEQLRSGVEKSAASFGIPDSRNIHITIGIAQAPRDAKDLRGLMEAADAALQSAKENGRNQVALPSNEEMVMKSCYYPATQVRKLKVLAERLGRKESQLLREGLEEIFRKYDVIRET
jgi:diguanylate cyclase (GGDEF)-like protein